MVGRWWHIQKLGLQEPQHCELRAFGFKHVSLSHVEFRWLNKLWEGEPSREDHPGQGISESNTWTFVLLSHGLFNDLSFIGFNHYTGHDRLLFWRDKKGRKSHPFPKKHRKIKKKSLGSLKGLLQASWTSNSSHQITFWWVMSKWIRNIWIKFPCKHTRVSESRRVTLPSAQYTPLSCGPGCWELPSPPCAHWWGCLPSGHPERSQLLPWNSSSSPVV